MSSTDDTKFYRRFADVTVSLNKSDQGKRYTGFRTSFEIEKTSESTPNKAKISIYNLAPKTREELKSATAVYATLRVGYLGLKGTINALTGDPQGGLSGIIFQGDIVDVSHERKDADYLTTLTVGDGQKAIMDTHMDKTFSANVSVSQLFTEAVGSFRLVGGELLGIAKDFFKNGVTLSGRSSDIMDTLCSKQDLEWSVQDGAVNVMPKGGVLSQTAILLNSETGLVGTPVRKVMGHAPARVYGYEITSLLSPKIKPGILLSVGSTAFAAKDKLSGATSFTINMRANKVVHVGDTRGNDWHTKIEAADPAAPSVGGVAGAVGL